jgi:hypothetical protein
MRHRDLAPEEHLLTGAMVGEGSTMSGDSAEMRVRWLVAHRLQAVARSADGWDWLFVDPGDARLWELTFPHGSLHGSGARRLAVISQADAVRKYPEVLPGI